MRSAFLTCLLTLAFHYSNAQLIINEVSQGTGNAEYVEFVVMGTPTCQSPIPTVDLRGVVLDDNNGYFNPATGSGIATGAIRLANVSFWSAVPQGTIIVIYNDGDSNPALPANDVSLNDGNCSLIIPVSSNLIEGQSVGPANGDPSYPISPTWTAGNGQWSQIGMANTSDSFQVRMNINSASPYHAVSWGSGAGNNNNNNIIYFAGSASGKVFSLVNTTSIDPNLQSNWISGDVAVNETPGQPNSPQNQAWIASMNPTCYGLPGMELSFNVTPADCGPACNGSATVVVSGGASPYTYAWVSGQTTATISNQCTGTYTVTVTDNLGCSTTSDTLIPQNSTVQAGAIYSNETCDGECNGNIIGQASGGTGPYAFTWSNGTIGNTNSNLCPGDYELTVIDQNGCIDFLSVTIEQGVIVPDPFFNNPDTILITDGIVLIPTFNGGGTWNSECGNCISNAGVFDPQISGVGTFEVCYTTTNGNCTDTYCDSITVIAPCTDQESYYTGQLCVDTAVINGVEYTAIGTYSQVFPLPNGCDSTLYIIFTECIDGTDEVIIPNVVTPNGDNVNDVWEVVITDLELKDGFIYNRWGETVAKFSNNSIKWNAKVNETDVSEGVYFYQLKFYSAAKGEFLKQGFLQVIR